MIPPEYINQIVTGDARTLAERIPDASVDLIFTDPVYDRIEDYAWLAETAVRVLRHRAAALVWCGIQWLPDVLDAMRPYLKYRWTLGTYVPGATSRNTPYIYGFPKWQCCVWMEKGHFLPHRCIVDMMEDASQDSGSHKWKKGVSHYRRRLESFTKSGELVFDPFTGGGTVPVVCKMLDRNYIAFEVDAPTADRARLRVANTQAMHPIFLEEQTMMQVMA